MALVDMRVDEGIQIQDDERHAINEFEKDYEKSSRFVDIDDLKKRINLVLEGL